eukprot:14217131-Alexandrium_andersonii.AAC.1
MSASLVGSEMCIRDRREAEPASPNGWAREQSGWARTQPTLRPLGTSRAGRVSRRRPPGRPHRPRRPRRPRPGAPPPA